jgi:plasmid maintenance system antidote protein VapI
MARAARANHRRRRQRNWGIADPPTLAALLASAINEHFGGNQSRAAREVGLKQPTLSRLLGGLQKSITAGTVKRLHRVIPASDHERLAACLLNQASFTTLSQYQNWLVTRERRLESLDARRENPADSMHRRDSLDRDQERRYLLRKMAELCPSQVRRFLATMERRGMKASPRVALALNVVIEPLLDSHLTGGIERGCYDLTADEFITFVEAGLAREDILLNRSPDGIRAQEAAEFVAKRFSLDTTAHPLAFYTRHDSGPESVADSVHWMESLLERDEVEHLEPLIIPGPDDPALRIES